LFVLVMAALAAAVGSNIETKRAAEQHAKNLAAFAADFRAGKLDTPPALQARCGRADAVRHSEDRITLLYGGSDQQVILSAVFIPKAHVTFMASGPGRDGRPAIQIPDIDYVYSHMNCKARQ
jgi:hypothetical protein